MASLRSARESYRSTAGHEEGSVIVTKAAHPKEKAPRLKSPWTGGKKRLVDEGVEREDVDHGRAGKRSHFTRSFAFIIAPDMYAIVFDDYWPDVVDEGFAVRRNRGVAVADGPRFTSNAHFYDVTWADHLLSEVHGTKKQAEAAARKAARRTWTEEDLQESVSENQQIVPDWIRLVKLCSLMGVNHRLVSLNDVTQVIETLNSRAKHEATRRLDGDTAPGQPVGVWRVDVLDEPGLYIVHGESTVTYYVDSRRPETPLIMRLPHKGSPATDVWDGQWVPLVSIISVPENEHLYALEAEKNKSFWRYAKNGDHLSVGARHRYAVAPIDTFGSTREEWVQAPCTKIERVPDDGAL